MGVYHTGLLSFRWRIRTSPGDLFLSLTASSVSIPAVSLPTCIAHLMRLVPLPHIHLDHLSSVAGKAFAVPYTSAAPVQLQAHVQGFLHSRE